MSTVDNPYLFPRTSEYFEPVEIKEETQVTDLVSKMSMYQYDRNNHFDIQINDNSVDFHTIPTDLLDTYQYLVKDVNLPDITYDDESSFVGDSWLSTTGRQGGIYEVSIVFNDINNGEFYNHLVKVRKSYTQLFPNEYRFSLSVNNTDQATKTHREFLEFKDCHIKAISGLQYSHGSQNQLTEFSITIAAKSMVVAD